MKLLIFTTHFYPYKGGLENYVIQVARGLVERGIKVSVLTFNNSNLKDFEIYKGVKIYRISCWNILGEVYSIPIFNKKTKKILKLLANKKFDYVNTHTRFFISSWMGMRFAKKNNIKLIHTEHGNVFVKHKNLIITFFAWFYDMTIGKRIFRSAWKVVGVSKACCNFSKKMGAPDCMIAYNFVNTKKFKKVKTSLKRELGIKNVEKVVAFVGRLIYAKGVQNLIYSLKGIDNITLLVVGDGPYKKELKKLAKEKKVKTLFFGSRNQEYITRVLSISDIFVNPSYSEGLPGSVLEAGAVGVPIIATSVGGTIDIIDDNKNGLLVPPRNKYILRKKIKLLLNNEKLKKNLRISMKKKIAEKFELNSCIKKYESILK